MESEDQLTAPLDVTARGRAGQETARGRAGQETARGRAGRDDRAMLAPGGEEPALVDVLPAALERAALLEWQLEQVTLREKDLWLRLEAERKVGAEAQQKVADMTARVHEVESALAEARRESAALTARLAELEGAPAVPDPNADRNAVALSRAWRQAEQRAEQTAQALEEAQGRLNVLEHAQVRFHTRLTEWQRQVATDRQDLDLAEFIAELRAEILRLGQVNVELRSQLRSDVTERPQPMPSHVGGPNPPGVPDESLDGLWASDANTRRETALALARDDGLLTLSAVEAALPQAIDADEQVLLLTHLARHGGIADDAMVDSYLSAESAAVRVAALEATQSTEKLARAAQDADPFVRRRALMRWLKVDPDGAATYLTRAVHDRDAGVRRAACAALAGRDDAACIAALLSAADDPDPGVRAAAVRALPIRLRARLSPTIQADPGHRRSALNAIRAERRARVGKERSSNGR